MGRIWAGWVALVATFSAVACGATHGTGAPGAGGDSGNAGGESATGNGLVDEIRQSVVDKVDLLLVVDNSISMADKQELLAEALPFLVQRLVTPRCVRPCTASDSCSPAQEVDGIPTGSDTDANGRCFVGQAELPPIRDLHVGVITSSLGSHGASGAKDVCVTPEDDDHAHLLGELRGLTGTWNNAGFLAWDPEGRKTPPGDGNAADFVEKFSETVRAAGELGCGYESTLEAWYRFLIDPEPPLAIVVNGATSAAQGIDKTILEQRAAFLRPDSAVAIVMLTDENDCSIVDEGLGFMVATSVQMSRSTSQCSTNPNDKCCQSCGDTTTNPGCPAIGTDLECQKALTLGQPGEDDLNLRCWQQKRRFGLDLLYPISRYSDALRSPVVPQRSSGQLVPNPLFSAAEGHPPRDRGLVFLAGIVGVPWQDLATDESLAGKGLRYLTASQLEAAGRWQTILGDPKSSPPVPPTDPLMIESPDERTGTNPIVGAALVPASSDNPQANPINGHEQVNLGNRDLQYACTFPLASPRVCGQSFELGCDCYEEDGVYNRPLCQPPGGGPAGITQYYAKAYPGIRHLEVLRDFGENAIVSSTCPKVVDGSDPAYGYNPAIDALVARLKGALKGRCLPRALSVEENGQVPCAVIEALPSEPASCDCEALGRASLTARPEVRAAVRQRLKDQLACDAAGGVACDQICLCEVPQLTGQDLASCQNDPSPPEIPGFCYVSAGPNEPNVGNPDLVQNCSADAKRLLRFVGGAPTPGATTFLSCQAAKLGR